MGLANHGSELQNVTCYAAFAYSSGSPVGTDYEDGKFAIEAAPHGAKGMTTMDQSTTALMVKIDNIGTSLFFTPKESDPSHCGPLQIPKMYFSCARNFFPIDAFQEALRKGKEISFKLYAFRSEKPGVKGGGKKTQHHAISIIGTQCSLSDLSQQMSSGLECGLGIGLTPKTVGIYDHDGIVATGSEGRGGLIYGAGSTTGNVRLPDVNKALPGYAKKSI